MTKLIVLIIVILVITFFLFKKIVDNDYKKRQDYDENLDTDFDEADIYK